MPKMKSNFRGLVTLLAKNLYPEPDVFVRELIQNAHDGIQLRRSQVPDYSGRIHVTLERSSRSITFSDDGLGMTQHVIEEFLSTIGASGTGTMTAQLKQGAHCDVATIGQFGIGLLSAFVVAERVDVYTRHFQTDEAWHWVNLGDDEYTLDPTTEMPHTGTQVVVTVKPEYAEFLKEENVEAIIRKYADLLAVPIFLNERGPINAVRPPWEAAATLPSSEREKYLSDFLNKRYPDSPLLVILVSLPHLQTEGVLYITDQHIPGINTSGFVDIYQNRMCVRPRDAELLPDWAKFVRGLVDTRSLQPTAARDNVHRNGAYRALKSALGDLVIEAIIHCSQENPAYFSKLCRWHHFHFKGMSLMDDRFFDRMIMRLPFETSAGEMTLEEYRIRQRLHKNGPTTIHYFEDDADAGRFYELCRLRGILALNAGKCFEEGLLRKLAQRQPGEWTLRRLDRCDCEDIYQRLLGDEEQKYQPLLDELAPAAERDAGTELKVGIRRFEPAHIGSVLLETQAQEEVDKLKILLSHPLLSKGVEGLCRDFAMQLNEPSRELLLNVDNPLVQELSRRDNWDDDSSRLALRGLFLSALLHSKARLSPENSTAICQLLLHSLENILSLETKLAECQREKCALRKTVENRNDSLSSAEWLDAAKTLYGAPPEVFRQRIAAASDEEVARTLVELITLKQTPALIQS
jgi:molecular chaperone HtpG